METGKKIADQRRAKNLTQEQLAEKMGVTRQTISRWESGLSYPEVEKIGQLARELEVSCDYLLRDDMTDAEGQGQAYGSSGKTGGMTGGMTGGVTGGVTGAKTDLVTRLLLNARGKYVRLSFYEDAADFDLVDTPCRMVDFDQQWVRVSYQEKKQEVEKMLPISSILAIEFTGEDI